MHDPQQLSLAGKLKALVALGRIPLASEVPLWTMLGCIVASKTFGPSDAPFDFLATVQCMLVTWGTNISINYGNEYFDWDMDRPGQVSAIKKEIERRKAPKDGVKKEKTNGVINGEALSHSHTITAADPKLATKKEFNEKIMGNTTRIIHDGTFPPWIALALSAFVEVLIIIMILYSRHLDPTLNPSSTSTRHTPFKGFALWIGIISTFLSHEYVGPPLQLHYNGFGEIISSLFLSPVAVVWGLTGYYTATNLAARVVHPGDLFFAPTIATFGIDRTLWIMLGAMYCIEQARVLIMHIHDIDADVAGGKNTLVVKVGYVWAARAYAGLNVAGVLLWGSAVRRLLKGKGAMLGGAGMWGIKAISQRGAEAAGRIWGIGIGVVLAYSIPIILLTITSLFAHSPHLKQPSSRGLLPIVPHMELVKLVSLQLLTTPVVLSVAVLLTGKV